MPRRFTNKYHAVRTQVGAQTFASKAEARRYSELKMLQAAQVVSNLQTQVRYPLVVNHVKVCDYVADFVYRDTTGREVVEDKKGVKTAVYCLKRKLMKALHNVDIYET